MDFAVGGGGVGGAQLFIQIYVTARIPYSFNSHNFLSSGSFGKKSHYSDYTLKTKLYSSETSYRIIKLHYVFK